MLLLQRRKLIRHPTHDYGSVGFYYVTLVIQRRRKILSTVHDASIHLLPAGEAVLHCWNDIPNHFPGVRADDIVIMPDHLHGIIEIVSAMESRQIIGGTSMTLGSVIRGFKSGVSQLIQPLYEDIWQRSYYDHIIRNDEELYEAKEYMRQNPIRWTQAQHRRGESHSPAHRT